MGNMLLSLESRDTESRNMTSLEAQDNILKLFILNQQSKIEICSIYIGIERKKKKQMVNL